MVFIIREGMTLIVYLFLIVRKEIRKKVSEKCRPFCLGIIVIEKQQQQTKPFNI